MSRTTRSRQRRGILLLVSLALVGLVSVVVVGGVAAGPRTNLTTASAHVTTASEYAVSKTAPRSVYKTDPSLLGRKSSKLVPVMIKYAFTPAASYAGGITGLLQLEGVSHEENAVIAAIRSHLEG